MYIAFAFVCTQINCTLLGFRFTFVEHCKNQICLIPQAGRTCFEADIILIFICFSTRLFTSLFANNNLYILIYIYMCVYVWRLISHIYSEISTGWKIFIALRTCGYCNGKMLSIWPTVPHNLLNKCQTTAYTRTHTRSHL